MRASEEDLRFLSLAVGEGAPCWSELALFLLHPCFLLPPAWVCDEKVDAGVDGGVDGGWAPAPRSHPCGAISAHSSTQGPDRTRGATRWLCLPAAFHDPRHSAPAWLAWLAWGPGRLYPGGVGVGHGTKGEESALPAVLADGSDQMAQRRLGTSSPEFQKLEFQDLLPAGFPFVADVRQEREGGVMDGSISHRAAEPQSGRGLLGG